MPGTHQVLEQHLAHIEALNKLVREGAEITPGFFRGPGDALLEEISKRIVEDRDSRCVQHLLAGFIHRYASVPSAVTITLDSHLTAIEERASDRA